MRNAMPVFSGFPHAQGGAGGASLPQVAQDHSARQHVASVTRGAAGQQRGRLGAAAQLRPAPPLPAGDLPGSCHAAELLHPDTAMRMAWIVHAWRLSSQIN